MGDRQDDTVCNSEVVNWASEFSRPESAMDLVNLLRQAGIVYRIFDHPLGNVERIPPKFKYCIEGYFINYKGAYYFMNTLPLVQFYCVAEDGITLVRMNPICYLSVSALNRDYKNPDDVFQANDLSPLQPPGIPCINILRIDSAFKTRLNFENKYIKFSENTEKENEVSIEEIYDLIDITSSDSEDGKEPSEMLIQQTCARELPESESEIKDFVKKLMKSELVYRIFDHPFGKVKDIPPKYKYCIEGFLTCVKGAYNFMNTTPLIQYYCVAEDGINIEIMKPIKYLNTNAFQRDYKNSEEVYQANDLSPIRPAGVPCINNLKINTAFHIGQNIKISYFGKSGEDTENKDLIEENKESIEEASVSNEKSILHLEENINESEKAQD